MADPFVAEIRAFPFNFAPKGWAFCSGQILPISQNTALFSLLGKTYGGDGESTFALPNLQGSIPIHPGQGPGLSLYELGATGGSELVTLLQSEIPSHDHFVQASTENANSDNPSGQMLASSNVYVASTSTGLTALAPTAVGPAGANQAHHNLMPYLTLNFCIALQGVFPARS